MYQPKLKKKKKKKKETYSTIFMQRVDWLKNKTKQNKTNKKKNIHTKQNKNKNSTKQIK